jgi:neutral ceramidase
MPHHHEAAAAGASRFVPPAAAVARAGDSARMPGMQPIHLALLVLALEGIAGLPARSAALRAGFGREEITPPVPYRMCGYFMERPSTGVHDPLWAKAVVLEQGGTRVAWVFCDLCFVSRSVADAARRAAAVRTGIPASNIVVAATHTHTGPLFEGSLRTILHERAVRLHGSDPLERFDYPAFLTERVVDAICRAALSTGPVRLEAGKAFQEGLAFNRRFHMRDGSVRFNPGKRNPDILRPAGPVDPEVGLLLFRRAMDGRPLGGLTVFALHLDTVGGTLYSADYPYYLERELKAHFGPGFQSLFGIGTCGDINHIDVRNDRPQSGLQESERIGVQLAGTVRAGLPALAETPPRLAARSRVIRHPHQGTTPESLSEARKIIDQVGTPQLAFMHQVTVCKTLALAPWGDRPLDLEVQAFRLSRETAVVALPGEVFVELGLEIKKRSPFRNTFVLELCNQNIAYVPTRKAFAEGSYEVVNSLIAPGGGEALVEAAVALLEELGGTAPQ